MIMAQNIKLLNRAVLHESLTLIFSLPAQQTLG